MYRSSVDNTILYSPDDIVLFRESPFAVWMERLTLENPDHGIPPDLNSTPPRDVPARQDDIVATLRAEGRNVALIDPDQDEPGRRAATLDAMRGGADFIVHGQFAHGALSGCASLLMRTSGYSDLGDFLYIPCETHARNTQQSAFRLCFIADLLLQAQGQLPPQLLMIRDGAEVLPLQTEDHIHYFRAVLRRFQQAMATFRKHRMPDPAESSHFGRWSECATEVIRQRALSEQRRAEEQGGDPIEENRIEATQWKVAMGDAVAHSEPVPARMAAGAVFAERIAVSSGAAHTLAEQARLLTPDSFRASGPTGQTPNLARYGRAHAAGAPRHPAHNRRSSDAALENLEFIGSSPHRMVIDIEPVVRRGGDAREAPAPSLRESPSLVRDAAPDAVVAVLPELEPKPPAFLPPEPIHVSEPPSERLKVPLRADGELASTTRSVIDLDSAPAPTLAPVVQRAEAEFERLLKEDPVFRHAKPHSLDRDPEDDLARLAPFSSSLITSVDGGDN